jgi:uncharacterized protein
MTEALRAKLIQAVEARLANDPSHDLGHVLRVLRLAEKIAAAEGGDLDVLIPAALFHDVIVYAKDDPRSPHAAEESAQVAREVLEGCMEYPGEKIPQVMTAIRQCSYSKGVDPESREGAILQDADRLEATGAIAVMRTFASCGSMGRAFYDPEDPFCRRRDPEPLRYGLDLFYARLLKVEAGMHTATARTVARRRTAFLRVFLEELWVELEESQAGSFGNLGGESEK